MSHSIRKQSSEDGLYNKAPGTNRHRTHTLYYDVSDVGDWTEEEVDRLIEAFKRDTSGCEFECDCNECNGIVLGRVKL